MKAPNAATAMTINMSRRCGRGPARRKSIADPPTTPVRSKVAVR
jgi:hypothetical protein